MVGLHRAGWSGGRVLSRRIGFSAAKKKLFGEPFDPHPQSAPDRAKAQRELKDLVVSAAAPISAATFARLQRLWELALADVRLQDPRRRKGQDGVSYHFAQWVSGVGYRSGSTWSPREKTSCAALVSIAEHLAAFVELPKEKRAEAEKALIAEADATAAMFARSEGAQVK